MTKKPEVETKVSVEKSVSVPPREPDNSLPGDDLVGGKPDNSLPTDPIPDQVLPGAPGRPEQGLPEPQPEPDQGLPGGKPAKPDNSLPDEPKPDNELPDLSLPRGARCPTCGKLMVPEPK